MSRIEHASQASGRSGENRPSRLFSLLVAGLMSLTVVSLSASAARARIQKSTSSVALPRSSQSVARPVTIATSIEVDST